jgi:glutaredoxin-dependent peroxiredoxin
MSNVSSSNVEIGKKAPDFELPDMNMKTHKLSDYRGQKIVLAFFPAAESPVCSVEMCNFRDSNQGFRAIGAQVIGISVDGPFANKMFAQNKQLNFPVLSDYKRDTIRKYGVVMKDLASLKDYDAAKRSIFVLDSDGIVVYKWISDNPMVEPNYEEVKSSLQKQ